MTMKQQASAVAANAIGLDGDYRILPEVLSERLLRFIFDTGSKSDDAFEEFLGTGI